MAAAYLFHIVQNHPFLDGNKRTGLACAYLFMAINGFELDCDVDVLANMVLEVARSGTGKEEVAEFFQRYAIEQRAK
ncbi:MAG: type II toxin-antitoxin system death-on-curing family toxin [Planctomycetota bacterium]|nr:type II toxin-antitoxin system death-on-curing family toxin [Planctomycetota bacterium]